MLEGNMNIEGIMGCSTLQSYIMVYLLKVLLRTIDEDRYIISASEPGLHIDRRNNLASDIMIFDSNVLTIEQINLNYAQVTPSVSIEIDTRVELEDVAESEYVTLKTMKLLEFGAEKVIWFFTKTKKVMIATPGNWSTSDWDREVILLPGAVCNVSQYLRSKGSKFA